MSKNLLLIGNSSSALARDIGEEIDTFDGKVVRFNDFRTKGYEDKIGSRTDIWITTSSYGPHLKTHFDSVHVMTWATDRDCKSHMAVKKFFPDAEKFSANIIDKTRKIMGFNAPSTGAIAVQFFSDFNVWIYGFDFFMQKTHHYSDTLEPSNTHNADKEWDYFNMLIQQGKLKQFGYDRETETMPIVRQPTPCGKEDDVRWYREPAHNAWYQWFGEMSKGKTVLDVGSGVWEGADVLLNAGAKEVFGFEVDPRLKSEKVAIDENLKWCPTDSVDVVTCVDVLEHCVKDRELMNDMLRIAREKVYVTTPNYTRSKCWNPCHCREYTIAQFVNYFKPTEVWSASPDGKVHRTKLIHRLGDTVLDYSPQGPMNKEKAPPGVFEGEVPITKRFNQTVDGKEWGHICGIFDVKS